MDPNSPLNTLVYLIPALCPAGGGDGILGGTASAPTAGRARRPMTGITKKRSEKRKRVHFTGVLPVHTNKIPINANKTRPLCHSSDCSVSLVFRPTSSCWASTSRTVRYSLRAYLAGRHKHHLTFHQLDYIRHMYTSYPVENAPPGSNDNLGKHTT